MITYVTYGKDVTDATNITGIKNVTLSSLKKTRNRVIFVNYCKL